MGQPRSASRRWMAVERSSAKPSSRAEYLPAAVEKALYAMYAGIAATNPMAVANRASAIEGATMAREVFFWMAMAWKEPMIPQTVPNRPTKGEAVATMARTP